MKGSIWYSENDVTINVTSILLSNEKDSARKFSAHIRKGIRISMRILTAEQFLEIVVYYDTITLFNLSWWEKDKHLAWFEDLWI